MITTVENSIKDGREAIEPDAELKGQLLLDLQQFFAIFIGGTKHMPSYILGDENGKRHLEHMIDKLGIWGVGSQHGDGEHRHYLILNRGDKKYKLFIGEYTDAQRYGESSN